MQSSEGWARSSQGRITAAADVSFPKAYNAKNKRQSHAICAKTATHLNKLQLHRKYHCPADRLLAMKLSGLVAAPGCQHTPLHGGHDSRVVSPCWLVRMDAECPTTLNSCSSHGSSTANWSPCPQTRSLSISCPVSKSLPPVSTPPTVPMPQGSTRSRPASILACPEPRAAMVSGSDRNTIHNACPPIEFEGLP